MIGYFTAVRVSDRKEFQKAAIEFQESFLGVLMILDPDFRCIERDGRDINKILETAFPLQVKAMMNFRLYLPAEKIDAFNKAWDEYCRFEAIPGKPIYRPPCFAQYHGTDGKLAVVRIHKLLEFAKIAHKSLLEH